MEIIENLTKTATDLNAKIDSLLTEEEEPFGTTANEMSILAQTLKTVAETITLFESIEMAKGN